MPFDLNVPETLLIPIAESLWQAWGEFLPAAVGDESGELNLWFRAPATMTDRRSKTEYRFPFAADVSIRVDPEYESPPHGEAPLIIMMGIQDWETGDVHLADGSTTSYDMISPEEWVEGDAFVPCPAVGLYTQSGNVWAAPATLYPSLGGAGEFWNLYLTLEWQQIEPAIIAFVNETARRLE